MTSALNMKILCCIRILNHRRVYWKRKAKRKIKCWKNALFNQELIILVKKNHLLEKNLKKDYNNSQDN